MQVSYPTKPEMDAFCSGLSLGCTGHEPESGPVAVDDKWVIKVRNPADVAREKAHTLRILKSKFADQRFALPHEPEWDGTLAGLAYKFLIGHYRHYGCIPEREGVAVRIKTPIGRFDDGVHPAWLLEDARRFANNNAMVEVRREPIDALHEWRYYQ